MNYKVKRNLIIGLDVVLWMLLIFFGFKYFTGC